MYQHLWLATNVMAVVPKVVRTRNLSNLAGMGKVRATQVSSRLNVPPNLFGAGQIIKNPCKSCHGQGRKEKDLAR